MIKVAMLQLLPTNNMEENRLKGLKYIELAKQEEADIVVFPEMWNNGYSFLNLGKDAIDKNSDFLLSFKKKAKELKIAILITFLEKTKFGYKNSAILFDKEGNEKIHYSKVHTCDFGDEKNLIPGDDFYTCILETKNDAVNIGVMICYDREFPESARILMLKGAEIILVPNACPMEINRISQLRGRAYENMLGIVTVNYPRGKPDCNGHSNVFDGVAYKEELSGSRDTLVFEAPDVEGLYLVDIDIKEIRKYREVEVHGNSYRRPNKYQELLNTEIKYPFIREDYRKNE